MNTKIPLALALVAAASLAACEKRATTVVPGEPEKRLTLMTPSSSISIERGGMAKADIKVKRKDCPGDLTAKFDNLPKGVEVVDADQKFPGDVAAYTLKAAPTADLVKNAVAEVTVTGPAGITVTGPLDITVVEKKTEKKP